MEINHSQQATCEKREALFAGARHCSEILRGIYRSDGGTAPI